MMKGLIVLVFIAASFVLETQWPESKVSLVLKPKQQKSVDQNLILGHEAELQGLRQGALELAHTKKILTQINSIFETLKARNDQRRHAFLFYATKALEGNRQEPQLKLLQEWYDHQWSRIIKQGPANKTLEAQFETLKSTINHAASLGKVRSWEPLKQKLVEKPQVAMTKVVTETPSDLEKSWAQVALFIALALSLYLANSSAPKKIQKAKVQAKLPSQPTATKSAAPVNRTPENFVVPVARSVDLVELPPPIPGIVTESLSQIDVGLSFEEMIEKLSFVFQAGAWRIKGAEPDSSDFELLIDQQVYHDALKNLSLSIIKASQISKSSPTLSWQIQAKETQGKISVRMLNTGLTEPLLKHDYKLFKEDSFLGHLDLVEDCLIQHDGRISYECSGEELRVTVTLERSPVMTARKEEAKTNQNSSLNT